MTSAGAQGDIRGRSLLSRLSHRLRAARPGTAETFAGGLIWGTAMAVSALAALYLRNRLETFNLSLIVAIYFAGGALAWPLTLVLSRLVASGHRAEARFATAFLTLTLCTVFVTAFLFAMQYRIFYAQWHSPFGTLTWFFQFAFTTAGAFYQFAVMGLGLFLPLGLAALLAMTLWLVRRI